MLANLDEFSDSVRKYWSIENQLRWCLDVIFCKNASRARKDNSPLVLNILRRIALNLVSQAQYNRLKKQIAKQNIVFALANLYLADRFYPSV